MKAVRRFNNNIVLCITSKGREVVARGKGIGFHEIPYEVELKDIDTVFYDVSSNYMDMIENMDDDIIQLSSNVIDYANSRIGNTLNDNVVFTLADHIQFTIKRYKENINLKLPILYDVKYMYPKEMEVGEYTLKLIRDRLGADLPKDEAGYIAMHLINSEAATENREKEEDKIVEDVTEIIEKEFGITINKDRFNYSRFVSHLNYLIRRSSNNEVLQTSNQALYEQVKKDNPASYAVSEKISGYFSKAKNTELSEEEKLYLMLHINRLCSREECNQ